MLGTTLNTIDTVATVGYQAYRIARTVAHWTLLSIGAVVIVAVMGLAELLKRYSAPEVEPETPGVAYALEVRKAPGVRELRVLAREAGHRIRVNGRVLRRSELLELLGFTEAA